MPDSPDTRPPNVLRRLLPTGLPVSAVLLAVLIILAKGYFGIPEGAPWVPSADTPAAMREPHAGLMDGRICVAGVASAWSRDTSASDAPRMPEPAPATLLFNANTRRWTTAAPMPVAAWEGASAVLGERLFIAGGEIDNETSAQVWAYSPASDTWRREPDLPAARAAAAACSFDGKLWVVGGWGRGVEDWDRRPMRSVAVFNPDSGRWVSGPGLAVSRDHPAMAAADGRLYVFGGIDTSGTILSSVEVFDPDSGSWCGGPDMPTPRWGAAAVSVGHLIYVIGGRSPREEASDRVEILNTRTGAWRSGQNLRLGRRGHAAVVADGVIYVIGGVTATGWMLPDIIPTSTVETCVLRASDSQ